ncbi:MAG: leucyl aminopeptidase [Rhizobiales bacterium 65-9]|nr:leucyl aminopeptidase family protein [Hyphomicrobiales bacterium]OJY37347.1 MAG: leucyl aminopeptidase [Rhizobiales bacterium 65-9]
MRNSLAPAAEHAISVFCLGRRQWEEGGAPRGLDRAAVAFLRAQGFDAGLGKVGFAPGANGSLGAALFGLGAEAEPDPFLPGKLPGLLPPGCYRLEDWPGDQQLAVIAFLLGAYRFDRYRARRDAGPRLAPPPGVDRAGVLRIAESVALGRDLINTPANDMGPKELAAAALAVAKQYRATAKVVVGDDLLKDGFPLAHAVGRGSSRAPRLVDIRFGAASHPKVTLVGKGVVFDTGGLDIKPPAGMLLMKKDMGGAAAALAAARMIMDAKLPVRLRVLLPIVENAVGGDSFRPGDILKSRKGLTVEIGNTDAEGRLILADALAAADEESPDLLIDFATLTGAARVALGPDLPPFYTRSEELAAAIARAGERVNDPVWRLPLWRPYAAMLDSKIADTNNVSSGAFAGSITAALFLSRFVEKAREWAHFDIFGWTPVARSGRPEGGEPQAARLVHALIEQRCAHEWARSSSAEKSLRRPRARQ